MARIAGVNIPENKHVEISLTHIFGIGRKTAQNICTELKLTIQGKYQIYLRKKLKALEQQ